MRKVKTITTQDHLIHIIETDSVDDETTCIPELKLQEQIAVFHLDGSINQFTKNSLNDDWVLEGTVNSPAWTFGKPNVFVGAQTPTSPTTFIVFVPKTKISSAPAPEYVEKADISNIDRESFVEIGAVDTDKKADPVTFDEIKISIDDLVPDDVTFE